MKVTTVKELGIQTFHDSSTETIIKYVELVADGTIVADVVNQDGALAITWFQSDVHRELALEQLLSLLKLAAEELG